MACVGGISGAADSQHTFVMPMKFDMLFLAQNSEKTIQADSY